MSEVWLRRLCLMRAIGARFVASAESGNHSGYKQKMTQAGFADLAQTKLFDGGWAKSPHRVIRNLTFARWEEAGRPPRGTRPATASPSVSFQTGSHAALQRVDEIPIDGRGDWEPGRTTPTSYSHQS